MSRRIWKIGAVALITGAVLFVLARTRELEAEAASPFPIEPPLRWSSLLASRPMPGELSLELEAATFPVVHTLRWGENLSIAFAKLGLQPSEVHSATVALGDHLDLREIRAGEEVLAYLEPGGGVASLRLRKPGHGWVEVQRQADSWQGSWHPYGEKVVLERAHGELDSFLEADLVEAGGHRELALAMSDILQWDLDFNRDLRSGDSFQLLYESVELRGEGWSERNLGSVLALVYINSGRRYEAYRFGDNGYYDARGRPLRKMFLRSPLPFSRVTSRFNLRRFHPVLKQNRPHYGVDYGAPVGTAVRATAAGTVSFAGRNGGAGRMVEVRHPNGYETSYLHLSGFAKGLRKGNRVGQGDVVGYVGTTGLSTGPHLDYRVRHNDRWVDPLSIDSEPVAPLAEAELASFENQRDELRRQLVDCRERSGARVVAKRRTDSGAATGGSEISAQSAPR